MTGWHAPESLIARYADGSLPDSDAWSLEKHLESCAACAGRVSGAVRATAAGAVLAAVGVVAGVPLLILGARDVRLGQRQRGRASLQLQPGLGGVRVVGRF